MNKEQALKYCYEHENEYKNDLYSCDEDGYESFKCLINLLKDGYIKPEQLKEYGMDY